MIPTRFLQKLGQYTIKIRGVTMEVRLVDRAAMVETGLSELKPLIGKSTAVGLMVYELPTYPAMLQLCVGTRCLLVHLAHLDSFPQCLKSFLSDTEICFVGVGMSKGSYCLKYHYQVECKSGIEVGELVARYFKKPKLCGAGLAVLASKVGLRPKRNFSWSAHPRSKVRVSWDAKVFSYEQIKVAIGDVYDCHLIGSKLLAMLL